MTQSVKTDHVYLTTENRDGDSCVVVLTTTEALELGRWLVTQARVGTVTGVWQVDLDSGGSVRAAAE
jgi:hypothetical protein